MQHTQRSPASTAHVTAGAEGSGPVGSDRVPALLEEPARHPDGVAPDELTRAVGSPEPTVHRAPAASRRAGLAGREPGGRSVPGDEFCRMAFAHHGVRPEHVEVGPLLEAPAARFAGTAHHAVLDGREVVHRAEGDPRSGAARLTSTAGGRDPARATGAGKALPAHELGALDAVRRWIGSVPARRRTPRTLCTAEELPREPRDPRRRSHALHDQGNETGVSCLALPGYATSPTVPSGAVSVSAPAYRTPLRTPVDAAGEIRDAPGPLREPLR
ncbi:IclR family transcriptional regulator C-terminal domain-containing protein [Streptomyces sp. NPDC093990]|uniref:IclR family transcriptional regulator domain-containing protein n=1 Tax=Streptomyces sp. NPDC093990 TaxID=3155306 RepID=UPI003438FF0F